MVLRLPALLLGGLKVKNMDVVHRLLMAHNSKQMASWRETLWTMQSRKLMAVDLLVCLVAVFLKKSKDKLIWDGQRAAAASRWTCRCIRL